MKRRHFLKTLPILAAAPLALAENSLAKTRNQRHLIALGTAAGRLVAKYGDSLCFDSFTVIDGVRPEQLSCKTRYFAYSPPDSFYYPFEAYRFLKKEPLPIVPIPPEIHRHLEGWGGELVFYAGLGQGTGTILYESIAAHYRHPSQKIEFFGTFPFLFEGSHAASRAERAILVALDQGYAPCSLHLDEIRYRFGNLSIRSAFDRGDEWVSEELNS